MATAVEVPKAATSPANRSEIDPNLLAEDVAEEFQDENEAPGEGEAAEAAEPPEAPEAPAENDEALAESAEPETWGSRDIDIFCLHGWAWKKKNQLNPN